MIKDNNRISRDIKEAHEEKRYIVTGKTVYQPFYSQNAGYYAQPVYISKELLTRRGRFFHMTAKAVNELIGLNLLREL